MEKITDLFVGKIKIELKEPLRDDSVAEETAPKCSKCGRETEKDAVFCPKCGNKIA